jgi:hypothetical protein
MYTLTKAHAALADIAETGPTARPILSSVHIRPGHIVAADGFALLDVAIPVHADDCPSVMIPAPTIKAALTRLKKGQAAMLATTNGAVLTSLDSVTTLPTTEGVYPDFERILSDNTDREPDAVIALDAKRLAALLGAMLKAGLCDTNNIVRIELRGAGTAVMLYGKDDDGNAIRAALMPMILHDQDTRNRPAPKLEPGAEVDRSPERIAEEIADLDRVLAEAAPEINGTGEYGYRLDDGATNRCATRDERDREAAFCDSLDLTYSLIDPDPLPVSGGDHDSPAESIPEPIDSAIPTTDAYLVTTERSSDRGRTWTTPQRFTTSDLPPIPAHATIRTTDDRSSAAWCERDGTTLIRTTYERIDAPVPADDATAPTPSAPDPILDRYDRLTLSWRVTPGHELARLACDYGDDPDTLAEQIEAYADDLTTERDEARAKLDALISAVSDALARKDAHDLADALADATDGLYRMPLYAVPAFAA